jgi:hypothetical protein
MNTNETTAGSLESLHDIIPAEAIGWWPPAPGWYVLFALVLILLCYRTVQSVVRFRGNAYRREAKTQLDVLIVETRGVALCSGLSELLKRTALSNYPRASVASLTGEEWLAFLDRTGGTTEFSRGAGRAVGGSQYAGIALRNEDVDTVVQVVRAWIDRHDSFNDEGKR